MASLGFGGTDALVWQTGLTLAAEGGSHILIPISKHWVPKEAAIFLADLWLRSATFIEPSQSSGLLPRCSAGQYETQNNS